MIEFVTELGFNGPKAKDPKLQDPRNLLCVSCYIPLSKILSETKQRSKTYQLSNGFGEEVVVAAIGVGVGERRRSSAFEMEMRQYFPIRQGSEQQLLRELFFSENRSEGDCGEENLEEEYEKGIESPPWKMGHWVGFRLRTLRQ